MAGKSPADLPSSDHPETIAMRDEASKNYHICVDDIYTRVQKMDHAYRFGTLVCKQTIHYTERVKVALWSPVRGTADRAQMGKELERQASERRAMQAGRTKLLMQGSSLEKYSSVKFPSTP
ncbi:unnamed protein product [Gadus morhua 'NCC']